MPLVLPSAVFPPAVFRCSYPRPFFPLVLTPLPITSSFAWDAGECVTQAKDLLPLLTPSQSILLDSKPMFSFHRNNPHLEEARDPEVSAIRKRLEHVSPFKGANNQEEEDVEMSDSASSFKRHRTDDRENPGTSGAANDGNGADSEAAEVQSKEEKAPSEDAEEEEPMEHDQGSSGNVEQDDDLTWLDIFAGSKAAILAASKDFETAVAHQDQGPVISEEALHALGLRISGACLFDGNFTVEGPTDKMQVSAGACFLIPALLQWDQIQGVLRFALVWSVATRELWCFSMKIISSTKLLSAKLWVENGS
jgi:hypothetical protein